MARKVWVIVALVLLCTAIAGYVLMHREAEPHEPQAPVQEATRPPTAPTVTPAPPPPAAAEPAIRHPLEAAPAVIPLPELGQSDASILKALGEALGNKWTAFLLPEALIHNMVATIDHLPRKYLPAKIVPLKRAPGAFITSGAGDGLSIGAHNRERYAVYVKLIETINTARLVSVYRQYYPLFQRAYAEIGYPGAYFNDRLIEAIDDLLAAPETDEPIRLVQPKVLFLFADPETEARSAGQKIMIRVGRDNALRLKAELREIRRQVAQDHAGVANPEPALDALPPRPGSTPSGQGPRQPAD